MTEDTPRASRPTLFLGACGVNRISTGRLMQLLPTFSSVRNPNALLRFYGGTSWHCRHGGNVLSPQQLPRVTFTSCAEAFGGEPNALPTLCN
jgi:hypothetical protein